MRRPPSLKRPLIIYPLIVQLAMLLVSFAVIIAVAVRLDSGGPFADEQVTRIIANGVVRNADGQLAIVDTPELAELRRTTPDLWFIAEDDVGQSVSYGSVPLRYGSFVGDLADLSYAQLRDREAPHDLTAVLRRETTAIGPVTILGHGKLNRLDVVVLLASNVIVLPIFLLLVLIAVIVTPWIVRRSLSGVSSIVEEAQQIDPARRGRQLSENQAPVEIAPLVRSFNAALQRLDHGYEQQRRFIASAAHELRTPIAILRARVETSQSPEAAALLPEVQRLATLAEQLLDLQRLDHMPPHGEVDLVSLVRGVVADLAPLVIASDLAIEVQVKGSQSFWGDASSMERVVMNIVQNAMAHGGQTIVVRIEGTSFEVEDDGPGIPPEERERVFEPFHRLGPSSTGSGLGLSLVRDVVERHDGRVSIRGASRVGTIVRVDLPPSYTQANPPLHVD